MCGYNCSLLLCCVMLAAILVPQNLVALFSSAERETMKSVIPLLSGGGSPLQASLVWAVPGENLHVGHFVQRSEQNRKQFGRTRGPRANWQADVCTSHTHTRFCTPDGHSLPFACNSTCKFFILLVADKPSMGGGVCLDSHMQQVSRHSGVHTHTHIAVCEPLCFRGSHART